MTAASSTDYQCTEKENHCRLMALYQIGTDVKRSLLQHYFKQKNLNLASFLNERYYCLPKEDLKCALKTKNIQISDLGIYAIDILLTDHCFDLYWDCCINKASLESILSSYKEDLYSLYQNSGHNDNKSHRTSKKRDYLSTDQWELLYNGGIDSQLSTQVPNEGLTIQSFDSNMNFVILSTVCPLYKSVQVVTANQMKISQIAVEHEINNEIFNDIWEQMDTNLKPISRRCVCGNYYDQKLDSIKKTTFKRAHTRENRKDILESTFNNPMFLTDAVFLHRVQKELNQIEVEEVKELVTKLCDRGIPVLLVNGQYQKGSYRSAIAEYTRKYLGVCKSVSSRKDSNLKDISSSSKIDVSEEQRSLDRQRYLKCVCLIQDVAKNVLVEFLKKRLPGAEFGNVFNGMKTRLRPLLNDHQIQLLYPEGSKYNGDLSDMDVTLLYIILRNLNTICSHKNGWGKDPEEYDRGESANLDRIRKVKNVIVSHPSDCLLGEEEFNNYWKTLRQCCVELGGEDYGERIDMLLTSTFSCDQEQQMLDILENLKEKDRQNEEHCRILEEDSILLTLGIEGKNLPSKCKIKENIKDYNNEDVRVISVEDGSIIIRLQMFPSALKTFGYFLAVIDQLLQRTFSTMSSGSKDRGVTLISISVQLNKQSEVLKRSRKSGIGLLKDFSNEEYYHKCINMHQTFRHSLPLMLHRKRMSRAKQIDIRGFARAVISSQRMNVSAGIHGSRLHTFTDNGWFYPGLFPVHLANAGFYYIGNGTEIHCHACNLKTDVATWAENEKPDMAHARLAKDCQFVVDNGFDIDLAYQLKCIHRKVTTEDDSKVNSSEHTKQSSLQEKQTNRSLPIQSDMLSDKFSALTIDRKISDIKPAAADEQDEYITETFISGRNDEPPTVEAMKSQMTQDRHQSYHQEFKYPEFQSEDARFRSFRDWKYAHNQLPITLSEAGYFYTGENDIVRCFCCDLSLAEWDKENDPWTEHAKYTPKCWFLTSQKGEQFIENIQQEWKKIYNPKSAEFTDRETRIATFDGWRKDIEQTPEILADAGFVYIGEKDTVRCHYCDGGLRNWEPGDTPWEEHARWFPFCKFVIKMKGREFIEDIKRKTEEKQRLENTSSTSMLSEFPGDIKDCHVERQLRIFGIDEENIRYAVTEFRKRKGHSNFSTEALMELIFNRDDQQQTNSPFADPQKIKESNRQLKEKMKCIRCKTNDICMLFVNCGHRQTCEECADLMDVCPICDTRIKKRLKTFIW